MMIGQEEVLCKLFEIISKLPDSVEQIAIQTSKLAGNSPARMQTPGRMEDSTAAHGTPTVRANDSAGSMSISYVPKTVKIDFPRYEGKGDPTIWSSKSDQFFQLHGIPVQDQVALASFHLDGDAHLWYQFELGTAAWEELSRNARYGRNHFLQFFAELFRL